MQMLKSGLSHHWGFAAGDFLCEICSESAFKLSGNDPRIAFAVTVVLRALNTRSVEFKQTQNQSNLMWLIIFWTGSINAGGSPSVK